MTSIKSKHSQKRITEFLSEFLGDYQTDRNLYSSLNCICNLCLSKIYSYDWSCIKAKEQENELRNLLLKTEFVIKTREFEERLGTKEYSNSCVNNPLNGVVEIIDDADYNDERRDDVKPPEMRQSSSKSATVTNIEIQDAIIDIKPDPVPICDVKPKIETPMKIQSVQSIGQEPNKIVTSTPEPPKKSKPIIVRVVKRVPFLKTNPANVQTQNLVTTPVTVPIPTTTNTTISSPTKSPNEATKPSVVKKVATGKQIPRCKYCDGRFPNPRILQVIEGPYEQLSSCSAFLISNQQSFIFLCFMPRII